MNPIEVVDVLQKCAAFDKRTIGEPDALAWFEIIGAYPKADALAAVTNWYRMHREMAMPVDILDGIKTIRAARTDAVAEEDLMDDFPALRDPDTAREYVDTLRARYRAIGDGATIAQATTAAPRAITGSAR